MKNLLFQNVWMFWALMFPMAVASASDDDRKDRIESGKRFLTTNRVDKWEKYFSEGLPKMGKIIMISDSRKVVEAWFEKDYMLIAHDRKGGRIDYTFSNPTYSGRVEFKNGKYSVLNVGEPALDLGYVYTVGVPFAFCSSINATREIIPRYLQQNKLAISDYRFENQRHHVEFEFIDGTDRGFMELIFNEDNVSMLPDEAIHDKGKVFERHFVNTHFVEVLGYHIPLNLNDKNSDDASVTEIYPEDRLNRERCYMSWYGLSEPGGLAVTDFGKNRISTRTIVIGLFVAATLILFVITRFWSRRYGGG